MKLALFTSNMADGGAQRVLCLLADAWIGRGHDVTLITAYQADDRIAPGRHVPRVRLDALSLAAHQRAYLQVNQAFERAPDYRRVGELFSQDDNVARCVASIEETIDQLRPDALLAFGSTANLLAAMAKPKLANLLTVAREGNDPGRFARDDLPHAIRQFTYRHVDHIVCNTKAACRFAEDAVPGCSVSYIPNPVGPMSNTVHPPSPPIVLSVARLTPQKSLETLIAAFARANLPSWRLAMVGNGELQSRLRAQAEELGITERIDWHGFVADPGPYYRIARMFVLPSRFEGMPNALMEAMRAGLPCIVTPASDGVTELVRHGQTGWLTPVGDVDRLADSIRHIAGRPGLATRLGRNARDAMRPFDVSQVANRWDALLKERGVGRHPQSVVPTACQTPKAIGA